MLPHVPRNTDELNQLLSYVTEIQGESEAREIELANKIISWHQLDPSFLTQTYQPLCRTIFHQIIIKNRMMALRILLKNPDIKEIAFTALDVCKNNIIHLATELTSFTTVKKLIYYLFSELETLPKELQHQILLTKNVYGNTILHLAIINRNIDAISIIRNNFNICNNECNKNGKTPEELIFEEKDNPILQDIYFIPNISDVHAFKIERSAYKFMPGMEIRSNYPKLMRVEKPECAVLPLLRHAESSPIFTLKSQTCFFSNPSQDVSTNSLQDDLCCWIDYHVKSLKMPSSRMQTMKLLSLQKHFECRYPKECFSNNDVLTTIFKTLINVNARCDFLAQISTITSRITQNFISRLNKKNQILTKRFARLLIANKSNDQTRCIPFPPLAFDHKNRTQCYKTIWEIFNITGETTNTFFKRITEYAIGCLFIFPINEYISGIIFLSNYANQKQILTILYALWQMICYQFFDKHPAIDLEEIFNGMLRLTNILQVKYGDPSLIYNINNTILALLENYKRVKQSTIFKNNQFIYSLLAANENILPPYNELFNMLGEENHQFKIDNILNNIVNEFIYLSLQFYQQIPLSVFVNVNNCYVKTSTFEKQSSLIFSNSLNFLIDWLLFSSQNDTAKQLISLVDIIAKLSIPGVKYLNLNALTMLCCVFDNVSITRLKQVDEMPNIHKQILDELRSMTNSANNYNSMRRLFNENDNVLPFTGILSRDLTCILENGSSAEVMGCTLLPIFQLKASLHGIIPIFRTNITNFFTNYQPHSEDEQYQRSIKLRPINQTSCFHFTCITI